MIVGSFTDSKFGKLGPKNSVFWMSFFSFFYKKRGSIRYSFCQEKMKIFFYD